MVLEHYEGHHFSRMTRWSQFVSLGLAQLAGYVSLHEVVGTLTARAHKLHHLGCAVVTRSSLARVNEQQPASLYEALFGRLLACCQGLSPEHYFRFKNTLYSLNASTIGLCLSVFPCADFRTTKGGIKRHVGLDYDRYLLISLAITESRRHHEATRPRDTALPAPDTTQSGRAP